MQDVAHYKPAQAYRGLLVFQAGSGRDMFCKGFLIQARTTGNGEPLNHVGAGFVEPRDSASYKLSNCFPASSGITHKDNTRKQRVEFEWIAPPALAGPIQFRYTCVQHQTFFYADLPGPTLNPDPQAPTDTPLVSHTTVTPTPTSSGLNVQQSTIIMTLIAMLAAIFM
jgi:hypothetical protein